MSYSSRYPQHQSSLFLRSTTDSVPSTQQSILDLLVNIAKAVSSFGRCPLSWHTPSAASGMRKVALSLRIKRPSCQHHVLRSTTCVRYASEAFDAS